MGLRPRIETWENGGSSTLDGAINDSVTSLDVVSAASFPSYPDFKIKVESEIMTVTGISTNTFTVIRGEDGTTAASHSSAVDVDHVVTSESLDRAYKDAYGADYDNGYPYNRILAEGVTKTASDFTWLNQGSFGTCVDADDGGLVMTTGVSEVRRQLRGKYISAPSTPYTAAAYLWLGHGMGRGVISTDGTTGHLFLREASTGKLYILGMRCSFLFMQRWDDVTGTGQTDVDSYIENEAEQLWLRIGDDGTNVTGEVSYNGYDWMECFNEGRTSYMAGGPDQVGFGMENGNGDADAELWIKSWILE